MLPDRSIPRPNFHKVFAEAATPEVLYWISSQTELEKDAQAAFVASLPDPASGHNITDLLESLSAGAKRRDSFAYCECLKNILAWPVNGTLVEIMARVLHDTETKHLRSRTIDWVMRTGTRFNLAPGSEVKFHDPNKRMNRTGKVISVDRPTASAVIETTDTQRQTIPAELLVA